MPKARTIAFLVAAATTSLFDHNDSALAQAQPCRSREYAHNAYTVCEVDLAKHTVRGATRKAAIGSRDSGLRTAGDRWIEPVVSSLFGTCFSPMLIFRRQNTPHTRVATHRMLSVIRPPELSHGNAESCRIAETMTVPKRADQISEA